MFQMKLDSTRPYRFENPVLPQNQFSIKIESIKGINEHNTTMAFYRTIYSIQITSFIIKVPYLLPMNIAQSFNKFKLPNLSYYL